LAAIVEPQPCYPLSPLQHAMLAGWLARGAHSGIDVVQHDVTFRAAVDATRLARAWARVAGRHAALRTRFRWEGLETPRQEVIAGLDVPLVCHDLAALSVAERTAAVARFLADDRRRGFDLAAAPLWRVALFDLGAAGRRMVWTFSAALLDDCHADVVQEVFDACRDDADTLGARIVEPPSYGDHLARQQQAWLSDAAAARAFWRERLSGFAKPSTLDRVQSCGRRDESPDGRETLRFHLDAATFAALRRLSQTTGVGLDTVIAAAWALVVSAFSGEDDVVFGEVRACRPARGGAESGRMVGLLINTVPTRASVPGERRLRDLLRTLDEERAAVRAYEHTPFAESASCADVPQGAGLFDTIVTIDEPDAAVRPAAAWPGIARTLVHQRTGFALALAAVLEPTVACRLSFDRRRFDVAFAKRVSDLMRRLLRAMVERPDATLAALPRVPAADERALGRFNQTAVPVPVASLHGCIDAQVDRTPDAVALRWRDQSLTYRQVDERASRLAAALIARGVGADRLVGVFVDRSLDMVVCLLGILKAGGAYLPLDPSHPRERLAMILADARPEVVLTVNRLRAALPSTTAGTMALEAFASDGASGRVSAPVAADQLAYVIYTSGSTGRPKGVQVEHRQVVNFFRGMDEVLGTTPGVWLAVAGISFDISVLELLWTLTRGFTVVVQDAIDRARVAAAASPAAPAPAADTPAGEAPPDYSVAAQIRRHGVTHLQLTPSHVAQLALDGDGLRAFAALRELLVGGEVLPPTIIEQVRPHLTGIFRNMYGPTETTIWSTTAIVTPGEPITIGRPIANTTIHVRSLTLRPLPIGVAGELLIGGAGVARGYLGRPDLTARRFVHDPVTGERLYRTGDLAAWRADGQLVFLGRIDHQVKIRGHRVELGEVEGVIGEHPAVLECAAVLQPGTGTDPRLVVYVVPRSPDDRPGAAPTGDAGRSSGLAKTLRQHAQTRLPGYMVPSAVVLLDALPLTPSGKADRAALAAPRTLRDVDDGMAAPAHDRARAIAAVMGALVGRELAIDDHFVDAGVHSLHVMRASVRLESALGVPVPVTEIVRHPTARSLAASLVVATLDQQTLQQSRHRARQRQDALSHSLRRRERRSLFRGLGPE
jgi:amino acid adenylation domain-containing protein